MTLAGRPNPAVLRVLKDVLDRQPEIVRVEYEPDAIQKRYLVATVAPDRVEPPTGPESPRIEVHWNTTATVDRFRIDYSDPNRDFHCGWHCDEDHPVLGTIHFQYRLPTAETPLREPTTIDAKSPTRILWTCLDRLFDDVLPEYTE